jgi:hypothetical protein
MSTQIIFDFKPLTKGLKIAEDSIKDLSNAFKDSGKISKDVLENIVQDTKTLAKNVTDNANSIETSFTNAFSKISVLKSTFAGIGTAFKNMTAEPMQLENAMNELAFVSQDVKNNFTGVQDELIKMGHSMPVKSTAELAVSMKGLATSGYSTADSLKLVEEATRGAVAGNASVEVSVNALKNILGAYNLEISSSTKIHLRVKRFIINLATTPITHKNRKIITASPKPELIHAQTNTPIINNCHISLPIVASKIMFVVNNLLYFFSFKLIKKYDLINIKIKEQYA